MIENIFVRDDYILIVCFRINVNLVRLFAEKKVGGKNTR